MMTDIASNLVANGQSYAQNNRQLGKVESMEEETIDNDDIIVRLRKVVTVS